MISNRKKEDGGRLLLSAFLFFLKKQKGEKLLSVLKPQYRYNCITEITAEDLKSAGAKLVLLDADNTLSLHGSQTPYPGVLEWIEEIKKSGINLVVVSNNSKDRIKPFAEKLGLPFVYKSAKPLPKGFIKACKNFGVSPKESAVIGDQLFTDVLGGNLIGAKVFLTEPLGPETDFFIKVKRRIEKYLR